MRGKKIVALLSKKQALCSLSLIKKFKMVIEIPDTFLLNKNAGREIRREIAIALFQTGWLTLKGAADFLGVSEEVFRKAIAEREISVLPAPALPKAGKPSPNGDAVFLHLAKPLKKGFDFGQIVKEQGYPGANKARLELIVHELDVQEPLDEMLATLTR